MAKAISLVGMVLFVCVGCIAADIARSKTTGATISDLSEVFSRPLACNGREFYGHIYLYDGGGFIAIVPRPVLDGSGLNPSDITVLPGNNAQSLSSLRGLKNDDKLLVRGRLRAILACFAGSKCVPFARPVDLDDLRVIGR